MRLGIIAGAIVVGALSAISALFLKRGYVAGQWGCISASSETPLHHATPDQFITTIERFLEPNQFDMLYVSRENDRYGGLMVTAIDGESELSVTFKTLSEEKQLTAFKEMMRSAGFEAEESSGGFNGGIGDQFRTTRLTYTLPKTPREIISMVDLALSLMQPGREAGYYVSGSRFSDGPGGRRGIGLVTSYDPLADLF